MKSSGACAIVGLIVFALLIGLPQSGRAADYTFTKIADTNSGFFSSFGGEPPINNAGTVAFFACLDATCASQGIFTGSGGAVETIVDTSGDFYQFTGDIAINDVGVVAFIGRIDGGLQGIFADTGELLTTIANDSGSFGSLFGFSGLSINNGGTVAFISSFIFPNQITGGGGVFTGSGGPLSTIAADEFIISLTKPSINEGGTVAFGAERSGIRSIFTGTGGPLATIIDDSGPFFQFGPPSINDKGTVAFQAFLDTFVEGIFTSSGGSIVTVANSNGPFHSFTNSVAINNLDIVAFRAVLDIVVIEGIFTGPDSVADKVIATGDTLFDSAVVGGSLIPGGVNNAGQIVFLATLADGTEGVYRADPVPALDDADADGIADDEDTCPNSDLSPTIVIDRCDSGVDNNLFDNGCTISDLIAQCAEDAVNHGKFVSCVAHTTNDLKKDKVITNQEKGTIQSCTTQADIP